MCLILIAVGAHPRYPLIVAANRDEAYGRPAAPAGFWDDHPCICGGRDLRHGGTWLGIALNGRFAAITNYRQGLRTGDAPRSRGELTREYLTGTRDTLGYLRSVEQRAHEYRGYSLIAGELDRLFFYSNRSNGIQAIAPGVHGLSNHLLDEPWPKVVRGISVLEGLLSAEEDELSQELFEVLADRTPAPDHLLPTTGIALERERIVSATFIAAESYGTRASTVIISASDGTTLFSERSFGPGGTPLGSTEQRFRIERGVTASPRAAAEARAPSSDAECPPRRTLRLLQ